MLVIAAENDIFGGGAAMAARAQRVIPDCTSELVRGAKHIFSTARMAGALGRILHFFSERCDA